VTAFVSEIVLGVKEVNTKTRHTAFELLVSECGEGVSEGKRSPTQTQDVSINSVTRSVPPLVSRRRSVSSPASQSPRSPPPSVSSGELQ
jgi:hypothetical protein